MIFVDTTMDYRDEELPDNLVVIENVDEWLTCIDCNNEKIVSWDFNGYIKEDYTCFDDYLIDQMNSAIENMQSRNTKCVLYSDKTVMDS